MKLPAEKINLERKMPKKNKFEIVDSDDEPKETEDKQVRDNSKSMSCHTFLPLF